MGFRRFNHLNYFGSALPNLAWRRGFLHLLHEPIGNQRLNSGLRTGAGGQAVGVLCLRNHKGHYAFPIPLLGAANRLTTVMLRRCKAGSLTQFHRRQQHLNFAELKTKALDFGFELRPFQFGPKKFGISEERLVQFSVSGEKIGSQDTGFPIYLRRIKKKSDVEQLRLFRLIPDIGFFIAAGKWLFPDQLCGDFLAELLTNYSIHFGTRKLASLIEKWRSIVGDRAICLHPAFARIGRQTFIEGKPAK